MIKKDIKVARNILTDTTQRDGEMFLTKHDNVRGAYGTYSLIYPYTNDILSEYEKEVSGEKVLTVAASGDQALMAIKNGAKKLQMFDINVLAKYYANLKLASVKALEYNEYINFFKPDGDLFFTEYDIRMFDKILFKLSSDDAMFWDNVYNQLFCINNYKLINECYSFYKSPLRYKDDYNDIKNKIEDCEVLPFIESDLFNIKYKLGDERFDSIIFSNITACFQTAEMDKLSKLLLKLEDNLEDDGIIQIDHYVKKQFLCDESPLLRRHTLVKTFNDFKNKYDLDKNKVYVKKTPSSYTAFYKKNK